MSILGFPISYVLIIATKNIVAGFDGLIWPGRLLGFAMGILTFAICANMFMGEGLNTKTIISLILATILTFIQVFWK